MLSSLVILAGCKEDTVIKANISPGDNDLGTQTVADTFTVITKSVLIDRLKTSEKIDDFPIVHALGTITDQFFGKTNAGIYFQVLPTVSDFQFSAGGYTIDSAVLVLPYSGFGWGNRTDPQPQKFQVYRVEQNMSIAQDYYSNEDLPVGAKLADVTIDMTSAINDTVIVLGDTTFRHIRIPLSSDFINEVRNNIGTGTFSTDEAFLSYFKGFFVAPDTSTNFANNADLLNYVLLDGGADYARLAIAFYYREDGSNETQTAFFNYNREKTANYNRIWRNFNGFPAKSFIDRYNSTRNISDDTLLLQNEPGMAIDIRIPYLNSIPQSSILRAELVLRKISGGTATDSLQNPNRLTIVGVNDDGSEYQINDFAGDVNAGIAFVDGTKKEEPDGNGNTIITYRINIPRELQKAINDKRNELHLRIKGARGFPAAYRLLTGGRNHSTYNTQLNIVYSKPK